MEVEIDKEEINRRIYNPKENLDSLKGFEIIAESLVFKIYDLFGRNMLLSALYQVGSGPGETIAERIKNQYNKREFELFEAFELLLKELKEFYSVKIISIEKNLLERKITLTIENHCFLRNPIKQREKLKHGKSLCRISKGYFETAFKSLLGKKLRKIEINFVKNDELKDVCLEKLHFYF
ncbi:MAG: hypothetical protein ACTSU4_09660 [Promethearchaeota archaeon]